VPAWPGADRGPQGRIGSGPFALVAIGLVAGLNPFFASFYSATTWVPIGIGLVLAAAIAVVARPQRVGRPAALAAGGLLGLGIWSLGSAAWAQSVENAVVDGDRILVYGALLVLVVVLLGGDVERRSSWLLTALGAGIATVAISVLARLLGGDPATLLYMGRLNDPLGYVNGEGCLFVIGLWLCWPAVESRRAVLAGAGVAGATAMACLALLSESRGTALAVLVSLAAVVLAAPGRRRRLFGLLFAAVGVACARGPLLALYHHSGSVAAAHAAGRAAILAASGAGVAWAAAVAAEARLAADPARAPRLRRAGSGLLTALLLVGVIFAGASARRVEHSARSQWHAFTHLAGPASAPGSPALSQSRLLSGAGNRYDYWRIAWRVWKENPFIGVGAGNYDRPYFLDRATSEDVNQPHSLELQTLAELGLVGAVLLLVVAAGLAAGIRRQRRCARASLPARGRLVAALGASTAWLTQTSVDWLHLLPGVTATALCAMAVLVVRPREDGDALPRPRSPSPEAPSGTSPRRPGAAGVGGRAATGALVGVVLVLVAAEASLSRQGLGDLYRLRAQRDIDTKPAVALREANRSLSFDADAVTSYYVKAAALARFDQALAARDALIAALRREPSNFVTWTLLGDIAVRRGRFGAAKTDYSRAHALNPRDPSLTALAADPRGAGR
jgi:hypothetical protein